MVIKYSAYRDYFTGIIHPARIVGEVYGCLRYGEKEPEEAEDEGNEESEVSDGL